MQTAILTDERFEHLVELGDYKSLQDEISSLPQAEVRKHLSIAKKCFKKYDRMEASEEQTTAAVLAMVHISTDAEFKQLKMIPMTINWRFFDLEVLKKIPAERKSAFIEFAINNNQTLFSYVREAVSKGLAEKPKTNAYVSSLISRYSWSNKNSNGLKDMLTNDPIFLEEDVWWLFEFEGTADNCLASADKYLTNSTESWNSVLVAFANEGLLPREKLLELSLSTQTQEWNQFRLGWYSRFHEALKPTIEERERLLEGYKKLLSSPIPHIVSSSTAAILELAKANRLKYSSIEHVIAPALTAKSKTTSQNALKILELLCKSEAKYKHEICIKSVEAIFTAIPDVQTKVFQLLDKYAELADPRLRTAVEHQYSAICSSVLHRIPKELRIESLPAAENKRVPEERGETQKIAQDSDEDDPDAKEVQQAAKKRLEKIGTLDDLVFTIARYFESLNDPYTYELIIDAISRLGLDRPRDFASRTSSILKRAKSIGGRTENALVLYLTELVIFWVSGETEIGKELGSRAWIENELYDCGMKPRILRIIDRLKRDVAVPVICTPEHEFGWLDSETFLSRLEQYMQAKENGIDANEICVSLMRCPLDDGYAFEKLVGRIRALSKDCTAQAQSEIERGISIFTEIEKRCNKGFDWKITSSTSHNYVSESIRLSPNPLDIYESKVIEHPEKIHERAGFFYATYCSNQLQVALHGLIAPRFPELHYALGSQWLGDRLAFIEKTDQLTKYFFDCMYDPFREITKMGHLMICLAFGTNDNGITMAAKDAFIETIDARICDFDVMKTTMRKIFFESNSLILRRWAINFSEIAKVSEKHALFVFRLFDGVLQSPPTEDNPVRRDFPQVLQMLLEIKSEYNLSLSENCATFLKSLKSSGKTKTLVTELLA